MKNEHAQNLAKQRWDKLSTDDRKKQMGPAWEARWKGHIKKVKKKSQVKGEE